MHHFPKITIGLILHDNTKYLEASLGSLLEQDYPNIEFLIRDQSPKGEAYDFIKKNLPDIYDRVHIEKGENLWHSGGHNALIRKMTGRYYFCVSVDMLYPPHFVYNVVKEMEKYENRRFGSATVKLMVWDFALRHPEHPEIDKTTIIDSCGLGIKKNHYFYDVGQGEDDHHQYDHKRLIFGASGALAIYRKEALEDVACLRKNPKGQNAKYPKSYKPTSYNPTSLQKEYFDELIHYKNDIDLAYRLQWAGWECLFIPEIKVYHDRLAVNPFTSRSILVQRLKARKAKPKWIRENSFFGQQVVLIKNFSKKFSLSVRLKTTFHQWGTLLFVLMFEPSLLKQLRKLMRHKKEILAKRDAVKHFVSPKVIERFMN